MRYVWVLLALELPDGPNNACLLRWLSVINSCLAGIVSTNEKAGPNRPSTIRLTVSALKLP